MTKQCKALQKLHDENKRLSLYEGVYEQEPVAWDTFALKFAYGARLSHEKPENLPAYLNCRPLYTHPPQRQPEPTSLKTMTEADFVEAHGGEQEPVVLVGRGAEMSKKLKTAANQVAQHHASGDRKGLIDGNSMPMQEICALIDEVCAGLDSPPQRQWVGLTDEEKIPLVKQFRAADIDVFDMMEEIESKLKEKNND
jgi:hypothetical protein